MRDLCQTNPKTNIKTVWPVKITTLPVNAIWIKIVESVFKEKVKRIWTIWQNKIQDSVEEEVEKQGGNVLKDKLN